MAQAPSPTMSHGLLELSGPRQLNHRSDIACKRCHDHKIKCSGETPKCRNCQQAKKPSVCEYPFRDRKRAVQESYLKRLEAENRELKRRVSLQPVSYKSPPAVSPDAQSSDAPASEDANVHSEKMEAYLEEQTGLVSDETLLQPNYIGEAACTTFGSRLHQYLTDDGNPPPARRPHYYKNHKLHRLISIEYQLPNRNYAQLLVRVVLRFIGPDYHLILRNSFLEKLDETYRFNAYEDSIWHCRVFVVFALGELYSERKTKGRGVPGTAYFLRAMALFQDLHEEPTIGYIETLLLIAFYSCALNRRNTAYTYAGLALRLSLTLGLHRKPPENRAITAREREHRIRVFWTVFIMDRVCSSKVGLPIMLRDEDIDVPLPSMDGLTDIEKDDFHDPNHINAQLQLARITGNILNDIYRIPQPGRANTFVQSVQRILQSLWNWRETLPPILKFNQRAVPMYSSRSVASLHLNFGQCVILTTRPIFFHLLRSQHQASTQGDKKPPSTLSLVTDALSEACVHAARTSSAILAQLWVDGNLATYGFFDALSIFSSTLILMMSSTMNFKPHEGDADAVETSLSLLKAMRDDGNMPANDYYEQLVRLKNDLDLARDQIIGDTGVNQNDVAEGGGLQMLLAASGSFAGNSGPESVNTAAMAEGGTFGALVFDPGAALEDPFLQGFLAQQQAPQMADSMTTFPSGDLNGQWTFDWENANLFGTV